MMRISAMFSDLTILSTQRGYAVPSLSIKTGKLSQLSVVNRCQIERMGRSEMSTTESEIHLLTDRIKPANGLVAVTSRTRYSIRIVCSMTALR